MFDVGFSELLMIAVVALIVLGPERLPKAARYAGLWVRRARAQWNSVKSEFEREMADDELRRTLRETQQSLREAQASIRDAGSHLEREFASARDDVMRGPPVSRPGAAGLASPAAEAGGEMPDSAPTDEAPFEADEEYIEDPPLESTTSHDFDLADEPEIMDPVDDVPATAADAHDAPKR
jgi:sec-independent protein translocase protein TatB